MKNLKFAVVDSSESYALKIQEALENKVGENADTVIITDESYFREFFSEKQTLSVLLIEKKFYSKELEFHNIDLICVLSDNPADSRKTNTGYVYNVCRSEGIDKVTDTMLSAINPAMLGNQKKSNGCKVVLVTSPLGGSGKTAVSAAVAYRLKKSGMKVLFADTTCFQTASYWIESEKNMSDDDVLDNFSPENAENIIVQGNVDHIAFFSQMLPAVDINTKNYYEIIKSETKKENYDYIIIDSESCFSADLIKLMTIADYVIIVALQDKISAVKMKKFLYSFECSDSSKYIVCCNKFRIDRKNYLTQLQNTVSVGAYLPMFDIGNTKLSDLSETKSIHKLVSNLI